MKFDLHMHTTRHSPDSQMDPLDLLRRAGEIGHTRTSASPYHRRRTWQTVIESGWWNKTDRSRHSVSRG